MENRQNRISEAKHEAKLSEWREIVTECRNSGKQVEKWCKEKGINEKTYYRWQKMVWEAETQENRKKGAEIQLIEVPCQRIEEKEEGTSIIIQKDGWRIELQNRVNTELAVRLIETVAQYV